MTMAIEADSSPGSPGAHREPVRSASARDRLAMLFPDPAAPQPPWWKRRRRVIIAVIAIAVVGSLVLAAQAFGAGGASYRTATVGRHPVDALLNGVATIEPVSQAAVAFPASGTVSSVDVQVGDTVTAGQALASLDPVALTQSLHEEEAAVAQAKLNLAKALNGEAVTGSGGNGGSNPVQLTAVTTPGPSNGGSDPVQLTAVTTPGPSNGAGSSVGEAQQAVLAAQRQVDAALAAANEALDAASNVCAAAGVGTTSPTTPTADELTACQTATQAVLTAQTAVSEAQAQLAAAATALDDLLAEQAASSPSGTDSPDGSTNTPSGGPSSNSGANPSAATASPSAADLVSYQQAVDAAEAKVAVAEQAIAQATIASPIAGTVQAVNLAVGDSVEAASSTANIVVVGDGGFEATTTVSVDEVSAVKVGQRAILVPDGAKRALDGTVTSISIAPDASASTTSYRVVISLADSQENLGNGSTGSVAIVTESSRSGLAVPTSAVTSIGNRHTVTVLDGSSTKRVQVTVGVVGATWTEITEGVEAGQQVVLADLSEPLPGSATESSGSTTNQSGPGAFPGGGPPGGFRAPAAR
jgi:RND family efflux transporter MFP subunit